MPPSRRWIRLDVGWEDSAWLDALDGTAAGCWPRLLCWVKRDGIRGRAKRPAPAVVARRWRVPTEAVEALERAAIDAEALVVEGGDWVVLKWAEFQEVDPTSAERSRRYRKSKSRLSPSRRDGVANGASRRPLSRATETETETETELDADASSVSSARKRAVALPDGWRPNAKHLEIAARQHVDVELEAEKMRDWAAAKGERRKDWDATFRNWLRNARPNGNGAGRPTPQQYDYSNPTTEFQGFTR